MYALRGMPDVQWTAMVIAGTFSGCASHPGCPTDVAALGVSWQTDSTCSLHPCVSSCATPAEAAECCLIVEGHVPMSDIEPVDDGALDEVDSAISPAAALCVAQAAGLETGISGCSVDYWAGFSPDRYAVQSLVEDPCTSGIPYHGEGMLVYVESRTGDVLERTTTYLDMMDCPSEE